jgi:hypothetical protein
MNAFHNVILRYGVYPIQPMRMLGWHGHRACIKNSGEVTQVAGSCVSCNCTKTIAGSSLCYECSRGSWLLPLKEGSHIWEVESKSTDRFLGLFLLGPVFPIRIMIASAKTKANALTCIQERQCIAVPPPDREMWRQLTRFLRSSRFFFDGEAPVGRVGNIEQFHLWNSHFPPSRRRDHLMAYLKYRYASLSKREYKKLATINCFVKFEKLDRAVRLDEGLKLQPFYAPRAISCFNPFITAFTGPAVTVAQNYFHKYWDGVTHPIYFVAGSNAEDMSLVFTMLAKRGWKFFMTDCSIYDSTIGPDAHELTISQYQRMGFDDAVHFHEIRRVQVEMLKGFNRMGFGYTIEASMKSGAADTCLSNSITNAAVHFYAMCLINGTTVEKMWDHVVMFVMGDDNLCCYDPSMSIKGLETVLEKLGLLPKLNVSDDPDEVIFLNMRPYPTHGGWKFGPRVGRILSRLGWATAMQVDHLAYQCAVGKGFYRSTHHIPILNEWIQKLIDNAREGGDPTKRFVHDRGLHLNPGFVQEHFQYKVLADQVSSPDSSTYQFMSRVYQVSEGDIHEVASFIRSLPVGPCLVSHPILNRIVCMDQ